MRSSNDKVDSDLLKRFHLQLTDILDYDEFDSFNLNRKKFRELDSLFENNILSVDSKGFSDEEEDIDNEGGDNKKSDDAIEKLGGGYKQSIEHSVAADKRLEIVVEEQTEDSDTDSSLDPEKLKQVIAYAKRMGFDISKNN